MMIFPRDPGDPAVWAIGQDAFGAGPALAFQIFHSATSHILGASPDDGAQWVLDMLAETIGGPCPAPTAVAVTSWADDPCSGGAYTHIPPGASPADADLLGEPIGGRLLFAGEHTQSADGLRRRGDDQRHPRGKTATQPARRPPQPDHHRAHLRRANSVRLRQAGYLQPLDGRGHRVRHCWRDRVPD